MQTQENRLKVIIPNDCAQEVFDLPAISKAMLISELIEEVIERIDGFPALNLSATTTQWLKAVTTRESLQIIENLSLQLMSEV